MCSWPPAVGHGCFRGRFFRCHGLFASRPQRHADLRFDLLFGLLSNLLPGVFLSIEVGCSRRPPSCTAGRDRAVPRRGDDQGRRPGGFDRGAVLPGLSRGKSVDGSPPQIRSFDVGAVFGDGSGIAVGYCGHLERPVGRPQPGPSGRRDRRSACCGKGRMRVALGLRQRLLHELGSRVHKIHDAAADSPIRRAKCRDV